MATEIREWLAQLGLERHTPVFEDAEVDLAVLPHLSDDDLKELGLPLGARRRIQAALAAGGAASGPPGPAVPADAPRADDAAHAERRQLTLLFCDLVGSTALASRIDAEEMRRVLAEYQSRCTAEVERFGGYVAKLMGDGALAYFGYPEAHEDDAQRAVEAARGIVAAMRSACGPAGRQSVRIGIATGPVVVGDLIGRGAAQESAVIGATPNLAARLQAVAAPDGVVIDTATEALAGGHFELEDLGLHELKGFDRPRRAWRVVGRSRAPSRFAAARRHRLADLVGRGEELEILMRRWRRARAGEGHLVLIAGEPGIGKSRLAHSVVEAVASEPHFRLRYQCSPFHTNSVLYPVIERIERTADIEPDDGPATRLDKLAAVVRLAGRPLDEDVPLLASLLSIPPDGRYPEPELSPQRRKQLVVEALAAQLAGLAAQRPVLFVFEDAHWADPTTRELLDLTVEQIPSLPVLMLVTHRPEFAAPWTGRSQVTSLTLSRLGRRESARLVADVCGERTLPDDVLEQIVVKTDGVPLFVEEFTRAALESAASGSGMTIPATLKDALEARLARLDAGREVAQVGAAIGRTFGYALLAAAHGGDEQRLALALDELVGARLLFVRGTPPDATYTFKHALVQDTAYDSLLRERRAAIHDRIARVLQRSFPDVVADEPEVVAHHLTRAGRIPDAIPYWQDAGQLAARRFAPVEAIRHLSHAIDLVRTLPERDDALCRELGLQIHLAPVYMAAQAFGAPEAERAYRRAAELATRLGDADRAFTAQWGLWMMNLVRPTPGESLRIVATLKHLAAASGDGGQRLQAWHAAWSTHYLRGEFENAARVASEGAALYDPVAHAGHCHLYGGHDPGSCSRIFLSLAQAQCGRGEAALQTLATGKAMAAALGHPPSLVGTWAMAAHLHVLRDDPAEVTRHAERAIAIAEEHGIPTAMWGDGLAGWAIGHAGDAAAGARRILRTFDAQGSSGQETMRAIFASMLSELLTRAGDPEAALAHADRGLELVEQDEQLWCRGELTRVRALALEALGHDDDEVDAALRSALDTFRDQGARLWGLRAAWDLARRLARRGEREAARDLLAPHVRDFPERSGLRDVEAAEALLASLA